MTKRRKLQAKPASGPQSSATQQSSPRRDPVKEREERIDDAVEMTFPASDPPALGSATGTEPPARPTGRRAPLLKKEDHGRTGAKR